MTMLAHSTAQHETPEIIEFAPDMLVVRDIDVSDPANDGIVSRFSDETWYLYPVARKPTVRTSVYFGSSPSQFRDALKRLVYCGVNLDTPMGEVGRPPRMVVRLSVSTVNNFFINSWRPFVRWLAEQESGSISEADADVLIKYREHVAKLPISPASKDTRMLGLWRMWRYAAYLPAGDRLMQPPWEVADYEDDISGWGSPRESISENRTRPIHPETMSALLAWSMRFVNDFSSDILRAKQRRADMDANIRQRRRDGDRERWNRYLDGLRRAGEPLPGLILRQWQCRTRSELSRGNTRRQPGDYHDTTVRATSRSALERPWMSRSGGQIEGEQWVAAIDFYEVDAWVRRLATACAVVTAYLSGMRPEECLALKRGCCQPSDSTDDLSGYEIRGLTFKKRGRDGNTIRGGVERRNPWYVIEPVARAAEVMERMHPHDLLFLRSGLRHQHRSFRDLLGKHTSGQPQHSGR